MLSIQHGYFEWNGNSGVNWQTKSINFSAIDPNKTFLILNTSAVPSNSSGRITAAACRSLSSTSALLAVSTRTSTLARVSWQLISASNITVQRGYFEWNGNGGVNVQTFTISYNWVDINKSFIILNSAAEQYHPGVVLNSFGATSASITCGTEASVLAGVSWQVVTFN